ncbi:hypothetical protein [Paenibacillus antibioticophila]|uniref:hypothetical protein n=1 Tax=Paenibacillus antibioticophila TaxID=1274374 RepID=UPI0005CA42F2|nr:hypothetical protein [Paenibacillus antibioticophila]
MEAIIVAIVVPILTSLLSYLGARHQSKTELLKVKEQQTLEIQKLREQQNSEIEKIREQSFREIEKIKIEIDKQAELYEKNKQTDVMGKLFDKIIEGDTSGIDALEKLNKQIQSGRFKNSNHPAKR